jgi:hypothetical protein
MTMVANYQYKILGAPEKRRAFLENASDVEQERARILETVTPGNPMRGSDFDGLHLPAMPDPEAFGVTVHWETKKGSPITEIGAVKTHSDEESFSLARSLTIEQSLKATTPTFAQMLKMHP